MVSFNNGDNNVLVMDISGEVVTSNIWATSSSVYYNTKSFIGSSINPVMDTTIPYLEHDDVDVDEKVIILRIQMVKIMDVEWEVLDCMEMIGGIDDILWAVCQTA